MSYENGSKGLQQENKKNIKCNMSCESGKKQSDINLYLGRIGILGGTFDPIHLGHISLVKKAADVFELDKVLIMPADDPYYKSKRKISSFEDRYNMVKLAVKDEPDIEASDFEYTHDTDGYTYDVLKLFKDENPAAKIFFIIGGDSLFTIESWKNIEEIFKMTVILVNKRHGESKGASGELPVSKNMLLQHNGKTVAEKNGFGSLKNEDYDALNRELDARIAYLEKKYKADIRNIDRPTLNISSTVIRKKAAEGADISEYVCKDVKGYIAEHKLYQS